METYCFSCKKNIANKNFSVRRTKQKKFIDAPNCAVCGKKKLRFINQEANGLLSKLEIKTPLSNIPLIGDIFKKQMDY